MFPDSEISINQYKVFISHGSPDTWVAMQMARCVQEIGATTFLDASDIPRGDNFKEIVFREISSCRELVVLFTPRSAHRSWVWVEVGAAWGQGKRVIAVLYGLSVGELEEIGRGKAIFEDLNIMDLNDFDTYLSELTSRIEEVNNG
jgi:hypothetical protein